MAFIHSPKIVTDGLVLALDAGNRKSYPGSGTTWNDLSGNNYSGSLTNGPTFSSTNGGGFVFDGVNDYGRIQNFNPINVQGPGTIMYWGSFSNLGSASVVRNSLSLLNSGAGVPALQIGTRNATGTVWKTGGTTLLSYTTPTLNVITNWCLTFNGASLQMYINGELTNSTTSAANQTGTATDFYIATFDTNPSEPFAGTIYTIVIYNRILSATEVLQNYNATRTRFGV